MDSRPPDASDPEVDSLAAWIRAAPSSAEAARAAVAPSAGMSAEERLRALAELNALMDAVLGGRLPQEEDGARPFWRHWMYPFPGIAR